MQNRIRELREERGMNQEALAGLVGVSQQKISKVERNTGLIWELISWLRSLIILK